LSIPSSTFWHEWFLAELLGCYVTVRVNLTGHVALVYVVASFLSFCPASAGFHRFENLQSLK